MSKSLPRGKDFPDDIYNRRLGAAAAPIIEANGWGDPAGGFTVTAARYAAGMYAVRPRQTGDGWKSWEARTLPAGARYSGREGAYILSPSQTEKFAADIADAHRPVRLQLSRRKGFDLRALSLETNGLECVNCARPGLLGNPFVVGVHGTRERCVELHAILLAGYLTVSEGPSAETQKQHLVTALDAKDSLRGKNLACWCRGEPCHASTLLKWANA
jgi:hypothetical protein